MSSSTRINIIAITAVGIFVGTVGVLIWYAAYVKPELDAKDRRIVELSDEIEQVALASTIENEERSDGELPVLTFEPAGAFSPEQKTEIELKLAEPYFDYYNEDNLAVVALNVREDGNTWTAFATYTDGSYDSFVYGNPDSTEQDYWEPQCVGDCEFSNTFRSKYPQIAN